MSKCSKNIKLKRATQSSTGNVKPLRSGIRALLHYKKTAPLEVRWSRICKEGVIGSAVKNHEFYVISTFEYWEYSGLNCHHLTCVSVTISGLVEVGETEYATYFTRKELLVIFVYAKQWHFARLVCRSLDCSFKGRLSIGWQVLSNYFLVICLVIQLFSAHAWIGK